MKIADYIGPAIRMLRRRAGKTQKGVAEAADISKNLLSNWERGTSVPSLANLDKTLAVLDADLVDLHNTVRLLHGLPAEDPSPSPLSSPLSSPLKRPLSAAAGRDRRQELLARAPEVVEWALELLGTTGVLDGSRA